MEELQWCPNCARVYSLLAEDQEDRAQRVACLRNHSVKILRPILDSLVSWEPYSEPVRTDYFYVLDEEGKRWVVKKWRENINEPFRYEVFEGRIDTEISILAVQKINIAKQLRLDAKEINLEITDNQIVLLICFLENQLKFDRFQKRLKPRDISISDEHPLKISVGLPNWLADSLFEFCQKIFPDEKFIKEFIYRESGQDGVLAFDGWRRYEIIHY